MKRRLYRVAVLALAAGIVGFARGETRLQRLPWGFLPAALSADGRFAVGSTDPDRPGAANDLGAISRRFRWDAQSGQTFLVPGASGFGGLTGVSLDGSVLAGHSLYSEVPRDEGPSLVLFAPGTRTFRWTDADGPKPLFSESAAGSEVAGMTPDGAVIVGTRRVAVGVPGAGNFVNRGFVWTAAATVDIEPPLATRHTETVGVSADGRTVAGTITGGLNSEAFIWTAEGGLRRLGTLPGATSSRASAISANGRVVIGLSGERAFRWTVEDGMVDPARGVPFIPLALSADGSVVVGAVGMRAYRWDAKHGLQAVSDLLRAAGVDVGESSLETATAISADGRTIAGVARSPRMVPAHGFYPIHHGWIASDLTAQVVTNPLPLPPPVVEQAPGGVLAPPVIAGQRRVESHGSAVTVSGSTLGAVTRVLYRFSGSNGFRVAEGTRAWRFSLRLPSNRAVVTIVAEGPGGRSAPVRVVVRQP